MTETPSENPATNSLANSHSGKVPQFGLLELFYAITVYAVGLLLSPWTILWTTLALAYWWVMIHSKAGRVGWLITGVTLLVLTGLLMPASRTTMRVNPRRPPHLHSVRQLMLAIISHENGRMGFPPAYSQDADGNPLLSWRVLILQNTGEQRLFAKFNLDEPWDLSLIHI